MRRVLIAVPDTRYPPSTYLDKRPNARDSKIHYKIVVSFTEYGGRLGCSKKQNTGALGMLQYVASEALNLSEACRLSPRNDTETLP